MESHAKLCLCNSNYHTDVLHVIRFCMLSSSSVKAARLDSYSQITEGFNLEKTDTERHMVQCYNNY